MARPTEWRRTGVSFAAPGNSVQHNVRAIAVFQGETVSRIRFQYQSSAFTAIPLAPWAVQGVLGIRVQNNLSTVPDLQAWQDMSSDEWMWLEGFGWREEVFSKDFSTGDVQELVSAPQDEGIRDIKAQRKVLADGAIWVQDQTDPAGGNQGNHFFSFHISALITLP